MAENMVDVWVAQGRIEGMALGMIEAKRADIIRILQLRFRSYPPPEITATLRLCEDLDLLNRWLDSAVTAIDLSTFRLMAQI
jgi:hypothetical protein